LSGEAPRPGADLKAAVEALRRRTEQYRLLAEQAADGVLLVAPDGRIVDANVSAAALFAWPRGELLKKRVRDLFADEADRDREWAALQHLTGAGKRASRLRTREGKILEAELSVRRLPDRRLQLVVQDATERKQAAQALLQSEERYERLAEALPEALVLLARGKIVVANSACRRLLGLPPSAPLAGRPLEELAVPDDRDPVRRRVREIEAARGAYARFTWHMQRPDGTAVEVEGVATPVVHRGQSAIQLILHDHAREAASAESPLKDALTGLTSLPLVSDRLGVAIAQAYRQRARVGVLRIDLDGFGKVNEKLGRAIGDRLLCAVGRRLQSVVREGDTVARAENDAFLLVLPGLRHLEDANTVSEKIVGALRKPFPLRERVAKVTASAGLAVFPEDGEDAETLLKNAERALQSAVRAGGDRYQATPGPAPRPGVDQFELEVGLRAALSRGQMYVNGVPAQPGTLFYQPFYSLATGKVAGVEALLRWQHPHLGLVFPQDFLSKSDFAGLILAIGPWILRTACLQARTWQRRHRGLRLAVNLSTPEMLRHDLVEQVEDALQESGLMARALQVEIPESHVMRDLPRSRKTLEKLKDLGVSVVLDRFGLGYSSLSQLAELPVDAVKLDLAFQRNATAHPEDASLLTAVVAVARSLRLRVLAQGIETEDQLALLRRLRCEEVQGFLMSAPAPPSACEPLFAIRLAGTKVPSRREETT
jgi:diguanylate cyclase (GGDEF)-like protein/PAS domain S-box-containing protein